MALHVRKPFWAGEGYAIEINGKPAAPEAGVPGFVTVDRTWKTGDTVRVSLPMRLRTEGFKDNPRKIAFLYGPIVLCAETEFGNPHSYAIGEPADLARFLKPVAGEYLAFEAPASVFRRGFDEADGTVIFRPFFREYKRAYAVYWDALDEEGWRKLKDEHDRELEQQRQMAARTVDVVQIGDARSEAEHNLQGERTDSGSLGERRWRHAVDGGWFSYDLKVEANTAQELILTFWGNDAGPRTFDLLVDGRLLGTITLNNDAPWKFFDRTFPLPADLIAGKQRITVRFQGHPGNFAGGVFGVRVVRANP